MSTDKPRIFLDADEVWAYAKVNEAELKKKMVLIAENVEREYRIYVTLEQNGYPIICVFYSDDEDPVDSEPAVSDKDCEVVVKHMYQKYLYTPRPMVSEEEEMLSRFDVEDEIECRDGILIESFLDFLSVLLDMDMTRLRDDEAFELLDDICRTVTDYGYSVYRPMIFTDDNGEECLVEYPYDV